MILRDKGTHYEVEMFHIVNLGKKDPLTNFRDYLKDLMQDFDKELNSTFYSMATGQPKIQVTESHIVVPE